MGADHNPRRRRLNTALGLGALAMVGAPAALLAQAPASDTLAALNALDGAERARRLSEGARREGQLSLYTSLTVEDMTVLNTAFEKRHGVKVRMWRASSDKVLQRAVSEARAGRHEVDVIETNALPLESMTREKLLLPLRSPAHEMLIAGALPAHRAWAASRLNVFVQAYNTKLLAAADVPKRYEDLLHPRFKGQLGVEATDEDWFSVVVGQMGEERGLKFFRDLVAGNGISVRKGHTLLTGLVASGEVAYALTVYNFTAEQMRQKGAPIAWHVLPPAVARANGVAVPIRAPNPHAALLYYDFMLGEEGQQILAGRDFVPTHRLAASPLQGTPLSVVDAGRLLDDGDRWARLYETIIVKQSRN